MELYIETLTGTFFELRVSPFETIMSVKAKIQRLEGIPIAQQHLIWQSMELEDDYCLHDYSIHDGATLKLVLAMRGGPINTRRIPMEDPTLREMAEYVEANRDEIWEKVPGNRQVTLLVFREGDQLNFFRVVDRGDGTLTPLSESLSGASMYNFNDEEEEEEAPPKEKLEENEQLKEKMKLLRGKMEQLHISKKPKRKIPHPPLSEHSSGSRTTRRRQLPGSGRTIGHHLNRNFCLPPVGGHRSSFSREDRTSTIDLKEDLNIHVGGSGFQRDLSTVTAEGVGLPSVGSGSLTHELASVEHNNHSAKSNFNSVSHVRPAEGTTELSASRLGQVLSSVKENSTVKKESGQRTEGLKSAQRERDASEELNLTSDEMAAKTLKDIQKLASLHETMASKRKESSSLENLKETIRPPTSSKNKQKLKGGEMTIENLKEVLSQPATTSRDLTLENLQDTFGRPTTSSRYKGLDRRKEFTLESLSTSEAKAMSGILRQASLEKIGSSRIGNFSPSKSRLGNYTLGNNSQEGRMITPEGRLMSARLQRVASSQGGRLLSPSHRLPPVKSKKKASKRCFVCGKKTGLATSYICRCGNNFCATHRYAESHDCSFDYKTEGRKLLEQSNPVVSAPKLPKI